MEKFHVLYSSQPKDKLPDLDDRTAQKEITCIDDQLSFLPYLSIGENLIIGCPSKIRKNHQLLAGLLAEIDLDLDLNQLPEEIDSLQQILLQMARSLLQGKREIYLCDVASTLTDGQLHHLLQVCQIIANKHDIAITLATSNLHLAKRLKAIPR